MGVSDLKKQRNSGFRYGIGTGRHLNYRKLKPWKRFKGDMTQSCGQCGKPAIHKIGEVPVCVDCYVKVLNAEAALENARVQADRHDMAMMNLALEEMDSIAGLGPISPLVRIPEMPSTRSATYNNISVDRGTIGAINTGTVQKIDVSLSQLHSGGLDKLQEAVRSLTEAILTEKEFHEEQRAELLEQIAFLSSQAAAAASDRRPGLIKATIQAVSGTVEAANQIATLWQTCGPLLKSIFGFN